MELGDLGHCAGSLAGCENHQAALLGRRGKMRRQTRAGMGCVNGSLEQAEQPGARRAGRVFSIHP
jgi:hypothetical protein